MFYSSPTVHNDTVRPAAPSTSPPAAETPASVQFFYHTEVTPAGLLTRRTIPPRPVLHNFPTNLSEDPALFVLQTPISEPPHLRPTPSRHSLFVTQPLSRK